MRDAISQWRFHMIYGNRPQKEKPEYINPDINIYNRIQRVLNLIKKEENKGDTILGLEIGLTFVFGKENMKLLSGLGVKPRGTGNLYQDVMDAVGEKECNVNILRGILIGLLFGRSSEQVSSLIERIFLGKNTVVLDEARKIIKTF